jgi:fatty acid desaturase
MADDAVVRGATTRLIAADDLRRLSRRSDARAAAQLGFHVAGIAAASHAIAYAWGMQPLLLAPAMLLQGWLLLALFAPFHETAHSTAFTSRGANMIVGWLCGVPALFNWHYYQLFHFAHHRHTQDPARDPELTPPPPLTRGAYLFRLTGWHTWRGRVRVMALLVGGRADTFAFIPAAQRGRVIASARLQLAATLALVAAFVATGYVVALLVFWIVPVLLAMPLLRAYLLAEHTGCSEDDDGRRNTRTTLTNAFVRATMWNMPFHAEHHLYPSIPFHALGAAHAMLRPHLAHVDRGYLRVTVANWRALPVARSRG